MVVVVGSESEARPLGTTRESPGLYHPRADATEDSQIRALASANYAA